MAAVTGTAGRDFICDVSNATATPPGFNRISAGLDLNDIISAGAGDDIVRSSAGADFVDGAAGSDILAGGTGDDALLGGDGNDTLISDLGADNLIGGAGIDTASYAESLEGINAAVGSAVFKATGPDLIVRGMIADDIENITGSQFADQLAGSSGANLLRGLGGDDTVLGLGGDDILSGGAGADRLVGGAGIDLVTYFGTSVGVKVDLLTGFGSDGEAQGDTYAGIENVNGSMGGDLIFGNADGNALNGFEGVDSLVGAAGRDVLTGGAGADRFVFTVLADSAIGAGADRITDFSRAQGDRISLLEIDANTALPGNQAFTFIGTALYHHAAGELRFAQLASVTTIAGDVDGDGTSDFHIVLTGTATLQAGDFVL